MSRKQITQKTLKRLFAVSGNRCAFPGCQKQLVDSNGDLQCQVCHIESANPGGERYNSAQTDEQRRSFENLLLLCHEHHITTNDVNTYTVAMMQDMKTKHEACFEMRRYQVPVRALNAASKQTIHVGDNRVNIAILNSPNAHVTVNSAGPEEKIEVSIIDEMFQTVLSKINSNSNQKQSTGPSISLNEKIHLNFTNSDEQDEVCGYIRAALLKMSLIDGTFKTLTTEEQCDITGHIFQKYNEKKHIGLQNIKILMELFAEFTPPNRQNDPTYTNLARALVLFFFEDCTIFEKTGKEKSTGLAE